MAIADEVRRVLSDCNITLPMISLFTSSSLLVSFYMVVFRILNAFSLKREYFWCPDILSPARRRRPPAPADHDPVIAICCATPSFSDCVTNSRKNLQRPNEILHAPFGDLLINRKIELIWIKARTSRIAASNGDRR